MVTAVDLLAVALDVGRQSLGMIADEPREIGDSVFGTWTRSIERDDGVNATAETIGNGIVSADWLVADFPLSPSLPFAEGPCLASLSDCFDEVQSALQAIAAACGNVMPPDFRVQFVCERMKPYGKTKANCSDRTITVVIKEGISEFERCRTVAHELWHVAQACALGFFADPLNCVEFDRRWDGQLTNDRLCMEWFAFYGSGEFSNSQDFCESYCRGVRGQPNCESNCVALIPDCLSPGVLR